MSHIGFRTEEKQTNNLMRLLLKETWKGEERSDRVLASRSRGCRFKPHRRYYVVSLSKTCDSIV